MFSHFSIQKIFGLREADLRNFFDELDLELVVPKLIQYVYQYANSQNAVWIVQSEYERIQQAKKSDAAVEEDQFLNRKQSVQSFSPIEDKTLEAAVKLFDEQVTTAHFVYQNDKCFALLPIVYKNKKPLAYILLVNVDLQKVKSTIKKISKDLSCMSKHISHSLTYWESKRQSFVDDLTGLYNQKYLQLVLENEIHRAQREKLNFSVLFMDVDYFKAVNDTRGHWVGSRLLVEIGRILGRNIRKSDYAFRYGGDEFVIVLPFLDDKRAHLAAERLRAIVEKTEFIIDGETIQLTLSIGLATYPQHASTYKDIIKMADEAMYCGKHKSRNVVFVAS